MLATVKGYYDGSKIVIQENEEKIFQVGDEVIITILDKIPVQTKEIREEKRRKIIALESCVMPTGRTPEEIDNYIKEMRDERF